MEKAKMYKIENGHFIKMMKSRQIFCNLFFFFTVTVNSMWNFPYPHTQNQGTLRNSSKAIFNSAYSVLTAALISTYIRLREEFSVHGGSQPVKSFHQREKAAQCRQ